MSEANRRPDRFLGLLGLAKRGGFTVIGAPLIFLAMRSKKPPSLVLAAADASEGSAKRLRTKCEFYKVPLLCVPYTKDALAHAVGKDGPIAALAVTDAGLAELLQSSVKDVPAAGGSEEE